MPIASQACEPYRARLSAESTKIFRYAAVFDNFKKQPKQKAASAYALLASFQDTYGQKVVSE